MSDTEIVWALLPLTIKEQTCWAWVGLGGARMGKAECNEELVSPHLSNLKLTTLFPLPVGQRVRGERQVPKSDVS